MSTVTFDPEGASRYHFIAEVEVLLGGVEQVVYPDGTVQFADQETSPMSLFSPRLTEEALNAFCKENLARYQDYNSQYAELLDNYEPAPPIERFWE